MLIDISQEVFSCSVFPGDPPPEQRHPLQIRNGDVCNLTAFSMCAHNGTHVDAPFHFIDGGKTVDQTGLLPYVGPCFAARHQGAVTAEDARSILRKAEAEGASRRILIAGNAVLTAAGAAVFAEAGILLFGTESQTVGPADAPEAVHRILLGAEVVLLEGIVLKDVPEGRYFLSAAPLNLGGCDGAPCRAYLMKEDASAGK